MAQGKRLTAREVTNAPEGFHGDGDNLYLRVRDKGSRAWVFRYKRGGRDRHTEDGSNGKPVGKGKPVEIGLGSINDRTLAQARDIAGKMRAALREGKDPATVLARRDPAAKTFKDYALELIEEKRKFFKSEKHGKQWGTTLEQYAYPIIGTKLPRDITLVDIKAILNAPQQDKDKKPLWMCKTETASRLRQRIEAVLDCASTNEGADRPNPARFKGNLENLGFHAPHKVAQPKHHAAAKHQDVPAIMVALREKESTSALCLRWTILTAARSTEARAAKWSEISEDEQMWAIPADRMKANRNHDVPLCDEARAILNVMKTRKVKDCDLIFPGARAGLLSDVAVNKMLHAIAPDVTVHGFRSSFRQWGAEMTSFSSEVLEMALAHINPNKMIDTYQQSTLYEQRRKLMFQWESYLGSKNNVVQFVKPHASPA